MQGERPERAGLEIPHDRREVFFQVPLEHLDADFIDPRGPTVPLDLLEGFVHEFGSDPPGQRVRLDLLLHGVPFHAK